jgi:hypothetical protein
VQRAPEVFLCSLTFPTNQTQTNCGTFFAQAEIVHSL